MQIEKVLLRLYGKPCWGVSPGAGSFLTLEFGRPRLAIREPIVAKEFTSAKVRNDLARRTVHVHGEWHLWIYCCNWEVRSGDKRIGDSSTKMRIRRAAELLDGQRLTGFSISRRKANCVFEFDLGATLFTRPYDKCSEQWLLYEPSHRVLIQRADGRYQYGPSDKVKDSAEWKPILP
jgi:hypothetical protein